MALEQQKGLAVPEDPVARENLPHVDEWLPFFEAIAVKWSKRERLTGEIVEDIWNQYQSLSRVAGDEYIQYICRELRWAPITLSNYLSLHARSKKGLWWNPLAGISLHKAVDRRALTPMQKRNLLERAVSGKWTRAKLEKQAEKESLDAPRVPKNLKPISRLPAIAGRRDHHIKAIENLCAVAAEVARELENEQADKLNQALEQVRTTGILPTEEL